MEALSIIIIFKNKAVKYVDVFGKHNYSYYV